MNEVDIKITEEEYENYSKMNIHVLNKIIEKQIPIEWEIGYGWYGCRPVKLEDGTYVLRHILGSSCD